MMKQVMMVAVLSALTFSVAAKDDSRDHRGANQLKHAIKHTQPVAPTTSKHVSDRLCKKNRSHKSRTSLSRGRSPFTRVYTVADLESTGQTDTLQALKHLDPAFF